MTDNLFFQCANAIEGKDIAVVTDIMSAQHYIMIAINDEGDFCFFPSILRDFIENEELIIKI